MRKPAFGICENKDADQLRGYREADQHLYFRYTVSTIPLLSNFQPLAIFCSCTAYFVGPGRKLERWFSHDTFSHMCLV